MHQSNTSIFVRGSLQASLYPGPTACWYQLLAIEGKLRLIKAGTTVLTHIARCKIIRRSEGWCVPRALIIIINARQSQERVLDFWHATHLKGDHASPAAARVAHTHRGKKRSSARLLTVIWFVGGKFNSRRGLVLMRYIQLPLSETHRPAPTRSFPANLLCGFSWHFFLGKRLKYYVLLPGAPLSLAHSRCVGELSETSRVLVIHLAFSLSLPFSLNNLIRLKKIVMLFLVLCNVQRVRKLFLEPILQFSRPNLLWKRKIFMFDTGNSQEIKILTKMESTDDAWIWVNRLHKRFKSK